MSQLTYLMDEICVALDIYYSGRTGGQSLKTAFILCDDYAELLSKLFLLEDDPKWSDSKANGRYKNFHDVTKDVRNVFKGKGLDDVAECSGLLERIQERRRRRNGFFHSTHLLDLNVTARGCVEAFCDLLDYGSLLFPTEWAQGIRSRPRMNTFSVLLKLERSSCSDPTLWHRVDEILKKCPRREHNKRTISKRGVQYAEFPEDLHLRMCVDWGGQDLLVKLRALLPSGS